ncbi:MAG: membrane dipeptidase [Pseudomonadota bacterium]
MNKLLFWIIALTALAISAVALAPPLNTEKIAGIEQPKPLPNRTASIEQFYADLRIVDMHADSLLWVRDLSKRSTSGQVDFPRLIDANVTLQFFMAVVESPNDITSDSIDEIGDQITQITVLDKWPLRTWGSRYERAEHLARRLHEYQKRSAGSVEIIKSRGDLMRYLNKRASDPNMTAALLGIEGAHPTEWDIDRIADLYTLGYRSISLAHYSDTPFVGSSSGVEKGGLTPLGAEAVKEMDRLGMLIDVAHVSETGIEDILQITSTPVLVTHVGVRATCPSARNLSDATIEAIADNGGVIGIGFFIEATCSFSADAVVDAIEHTRNLVGADHVALGSGFDIAPMPIGLSDLSVLVQLMTDRGFSEQEIRAIMGENVLNLILQVLE